MKDWSWRLTACSSTAFIWASSSQLHPSLAFRSVHHHDAPIVKHGNNWPNCILLDPRTVGGAGHVYRCLAAAATENNAEPAGENSPKPKRASKGKSTSKTNARSGTIQKEEPITKRSAEKKQAKKARSISKGSFEKKSLSSTKVSSKTSKTNLSEKSSSVKLRERNQRNNQTAVDQDAVYIQFSRVFQRHVVYHKNVDEAGNFKTEVLQSFEFLDEATAHYPGVTILAPKDLSFPPPTCSISFDDDDETGRGRKRARDKDECETTIAGMGLTSLCELEYPFQNVSQVPGWVPVNENLTDTLGYRYDQSQDAIRTLLSLVLTPRTNKEWFSLMNLPRHYDRLDEKRFAMRGMTSEMILTNYARLTQLFTGVLGLEFDDAEFAVCNFPQLCLYNSDELETMVRFLIAPLPPEDYVSVYMVADEGTRGSSVDWPSVASKGYGAGLTAKQAGEVVRVMPEVLALYYEDSLKPSIAYMYNKLAMFTGPDYLETTVATLRKILEGTSLSDTWFFSFLAYNGLTWRQMRILSASLKLLRNCNLEPSWQIIQQYDRVRKKLKRYELDYLRQRLQIEPSDVQNMIKIHPRLSQYDACFNMKPTLNKLQHSFGLTSREMAKTIQRMPPLIGMSADNIDDKVHWFMTSAGLTKAQCKSCLLKQPSLIQYSRSNTLQPKVNFFTHELGVGSLLPRIITATPALMGYSLSENLRPKVIYLMNRCALDQFQVGVLVATSPSLLTLSVKGKLEPTLARISLLLNVSGHVELGRIVTASPRMLHQSISSLEGKFDLLATLLKSSEKASTILRNNPSLLQWSLNAFKDRLDQYSNSDTDLLSRLQPSSSGRTKLITDAVPKSKYNDAVIISADPSFNSIEHICPDLTVAAEEAGVSISQIKSAIKDSACVQGKFFSYVDILPPRGQELTVNPGAVPISIVVTSQIYPNDNVNYVRGESRSGGVCLTVIDDGQEDYESITEDFRSAAASCFALIPNPYPASSKNILTIFPLLNASKNRVGLFSLWGALRVVETLLKKRRARDDTREYDIKVFSDSNYALKLVMDRDRMLKLGSSLTYNEELLTSLGMNQAYSNIDILHPLVRSYSRINGQEEPVQSSNYKIDGASLDFFHSMQIQGNELCALTSPLKKQAKYVALWQTTKEL